MLNEAFYDIFKQFCRTAINIAETEETAEKKKERLAKTRASNKKRCSEETTEKRKKDLQKKELVIRNSDLKKQLKKGKKHLQKGEPIIKKILSTICRKEAKKIDGFSNS